MRIAADKIGHLKAGAKAALFGLAVGAVLGAAMAKAQALPGLLAPLVVLLCAGVGALLAAVSAGAAKELADKADNVIYPGMHGVEWQDAAFTAVPGVVLCAATFALASLIYQGLLPW